MTGIGLLAFYLLLPTPRQKLPDNLVWKEMEQIARQHALSPDFLYALAQAESSLDAYADSGYARGLMQMSRIAWEEASPLPYHRAWDWRINLRVAVSYILWIRERLEAENQFDYPRLAAAYRYGFYALAGAGFDITRLPPPHNKIYQQLFAGEGIPVPRPKRL